MAACKVLTYFEVMSGWRGAPAKYGDRWSFMHEINYCADLAIGFLPQEDPLLSLTSGYAIWDEVGRDLPKYLMSGKVRKWLSGIPKLDTAAMNDHRELERAMLLLSYFGSAWVWGEEEVNAVIPANIAVPWCDVAAKMGRPPILSYASHALNNWRRLEASRGIELGNIARLLNF